MFAMVGSERLIWIKVVDVNEDLGLVYCQIRDSKLRLPNGTELRLVFSDKELERIKEDS